MRYFNFFWLGIVLAYCRAPLADWIAARPAAFATALGWLGLALCALLPAPPDPAALGEALRLPLVSISASRQSLYNTFAPRSGFRAFCTQQWISLIGSACYSMYLIHLQVTQVIASTCGQGKEPGAQLAAVAAMFLASALVIDAVGLSYYVLVERRFMTRDWHLLAWAAAKRALGREAASAPVDQRPKLAVSREEASEAPPRSAAPNRSAGAGRG